MKTARVLVTAAGGIVSQGIIKALKLASDRNYNSASTSYFITATDVSPLAAGLYRSDTAAIIPPASAPDYVDSIIRTCEANNIEAIFVGSDEELPILARSRATIESESGAILIAGSGEKLSIARDKWRTYQFCKEKQIKCAPTVLPENSETIVREFGFPVVVKPREGFGSVQFYLAKSIEQMNDAIRSIQTFGWRPVVQKFIDGEEFTSGITIDSTGCYVMSSISIRKLIKQGQTYKAFIDDFDHVRKPAELAALKLGIKGPVNIQARLDGNEPMVIEINPRFSATCPMRAVAGINEPDIVFRNSARGEQIKVDKYQRLICLRYWNEVYLQEKLLEDISLSGRLENNNGSFIPNYF